MNMDLQGHSPQTLLNRFQTVRKISQDLTEPLHPEDQVIQSMPDASPIKWHLAHTSWFFETFVLAPNLPNYQDFQAEFTYLFNSYYNQVGPQYLRPNRGLISRPTVDEVREYRQYVDRHIDQLLTQEQISQQCLELIELGLHHEQQHQELMLTDIKHAFSFNPLNPAIADYQGPDNPGPDKQTTPQHWIAFPGGEFLAGYAGKAFHFDNETPSHPVLLQPFQLSQRLVTNEEYLAFINDGGYQNPLLWLSDGWAWCQQNRIEHPLYWHLRDGEWLQYTLSGMRPLSAREPVCHISYYEADAFAQWHGKRLPTEFEWETAAKQQRDALLGEQAGFLDLACLHPQHQASIAQACSNCMAPAGNGPAAPTALIRVSHLQQAPLVNTMASSCAINGC